MSWVGSLTDGSSAGRGWSSGVMRCCRRLEPTGIARAASVWCHCRFFRDALADRCSWWVRYPATRSSVAGVLWGLFLVVRCDAAPERIRQESRAHAQSGLFAEALASVSARAPGWVRSLWSASSFWLCRRGAGLPCRCASFAWWFSSVLLCAVRSCGHSTTRFSARSRSSAGDSC